MSSQRESPRTQPNRIAILTSLPYLHVYGRRQRTAADAIVRLDPNRVSPIGQQVSDGRQLRVVDLVDGPQRYGQLFLQGVIYSVALVDKHSDVRHSSTIYTPRLVEIIRIT